MTHCIYCDTDKPESEFTDEHIWPDALGGDHLDPLWRVRVCGGCNSSSGLFVDGAFIKNWVGVSERFSGASEYLSLTNPLQSAYPLAYMGVLTSAPSQSNEIAELWLGPCGAHVVHIRPDDKDPVWNTFAGGDPRLRKSRAGRAYMSATTKELFWLSVGLASFRRHFNKSQRFLTNIGLPPAEQAIYGAVPDNTDPVQAQDMQVVQTVQRAAQNSQPLGTTLVTSADVGSRLLAKLALAIGFKIFGDPFLSSQNAIFCRQAFKEGNPAKRAAILLRGSGYFSGRIPPDVGKILAWPGAWVLVLWKLDTGLSLNVVGPSSKLMSVVVCDDAQLLQSLPAEYNDGLIWVTVPPLREAVGPVSLPDYLGHKHGAIPIDEFVDLDAKRIDPKTLPAC